MPAEDQLRPDIWQEDTGSAEAANMGARIQPGTDMKGSMQEQQASTGSGGVLHLVTTEQTKQLAEIPNTAHALHDPSLDALRAALAGVKVRATTVYISSPLPKDTRQQPYAANLLDLQLRGEGAPDESSGCRISRVELAAVSGFFAKLASSQQPSGTLDLPVCHAGVELLVNAVYTRKVELDGESVVDLLQAASYLQVECCMDAVNRFLFKDVIIHRPKQVVRVARSLGLQEHLYDCLTAHFYKRSPGILARLLHVLGTEAAVQLLQRDDLCCPLESFLVEVLEALNAKYPGAPLEPLMDAVRWSAMPLWELDAALYRLQGNAQPDGRPSRLLCRILHEILEREGATTVTGQPRAAARRTLQLMGKVDSKGRLVAAKSAQQHIEGLGNVYLRSFAGKDARPSVFGLRAVDEKFTSYPQAVFLAVAADGQHHEKLTSDYRPPSFFFYSRDFLAAPLKQPLTQGGKNVLLLACYVLER